MLAAVEEGFAIHQTLTDIHPENQIRPFAFNFIEWETTQEDSCGSRKHLLVALRVERHKFDRSFSLKRILLVAGALVRAVKTFQYAFVMLIWSNMPFASFDTARRARQSLGGNDATAPESFSSARLSLLVLVFAV